MDTRYDLTAVELLNILGFSMPQTPECVEECNKREKELGVTFPKMLKNVLLIVHDLPMLKDSDLFCDFGRITLLSRVYMGMDKKMDELQSYFGVDSEDLYEAEDNYYLEEDSDEQLRSETPCLQDLFAEFVAGITDYLLIGSNIFTKNHSKDFSYDWDSVLFGIRKKDLNKKNPPVYINYHYHSDGTVWHRFCDSLSEFLLTVLYDSLLGMDNRTAVKELKKQEWNIYDYKNIYDIQNLLAVKEIDSSKMRRVKSCYPLEKVADAFKMACCYKKEEQALYMVQYVGRAIKVCVLAKNHTIIHADKNSPLYKETFSSPLNLFTMQDFVEVLSPDFIYAGHERITQNGDDRIVITVRACDRGSGCRACLDLESIRDGGKECKKQVHCPFCGEKVYNADEVFYIEQWLGLRIEGTAILLRRPCMTYYCENSDCVTHKEPLKGYFNSLNVKNDIEEIDNIYTDFMEDEWNERQVLELLGLS